jgi:hypothetical protein
MELALQGKAKTFESCRTRHFGTELGTPKPAVFALESSDESAQEHAFRSHGAQFLLIDFDALGKRAEVIAAIAAAIGPHALAGSPGKRLQSLWRDGRARVFDRILSASRRA